MLSVFAVGHASSEGNEKASHRGIAVGIRAGKYLDPHPYNCFRVAQRTWADKVVTVC